VKNHPKRGILQRVILEAHENHANLVEENDSLVEYAELDQVKIQSFQIDLY
jgi:hypothetical protein